MRYAALAVPALFLFGCSASVPPPQDQFAAAQRDLGRAQESGATMVPDAQLHLRLAQEDLAMAKQLMMRNNSDDNKRAITLTSRADAEAELSLNLAHAAQLNDEASRARGALNQNAPNGAPLPPAANAGPMPQPGTTTLTGAPLDMPNNKK